MTPCSLTSVALLILLPY